MKTIPVCILEVLKAGQYQPANGWSDPSIMRNCRIVAESGLYRKTIPLACVVVDLLADRQPDTVRGVMYAVVSAGWLPDTGQASYNKVQQILLYLRRRGIVPYKWIVDNCRETHKPSSWSGLNDFADTVANSYRLDFWASLPEYVTIIVEKDTVAGRIQPVTEEFDVALHALRGQSSETFAQLIGLQLKKITKPIRVYYVGDHDPSGRSIERVIRSKVEKFAGKAIHWVRLGVEPHQFGKYNIIPLKPKPSDKNTPRFIAEFGELCAEVEAIPADTLRDLVRDAIELHIPAAQWESLKVIEAKEKESWNSVMQTMRGAA